MYHDEATHNDKEGWEVPEQEDNAIDINEEEYDEEDDWQDTNVIDYWQAAFKGYMSYHKKDADPAILIPAPKRRPKRDDHTKGTKRKWEDDDDDEVEEQQQQDDEIEEEQQEEEEQGYEEEAIEDTQWKDAEQQETADQQQYNDSYQYYNYYHQQQQYPQSHQGYASGNVSGQGFGAQPPPPPPPPPPPFPGNPSFMAAQDNEAFANMIMAWYYSGYYTGYYQARRG